VAREGKTTVIPVLRGMDEKNVPLELGKNNLSADTVVARAYSPTLPEGQIIDTFPPGGAEVPEHTAVSLLVSRGQRPRDYYMPDLISSREQEARATIEPLGASVTVEREAVPQRSLHGIVIGQTPKPGERVNSRTLINLTVGTAAN
jgi:beta-lactam-binding protein with PASTA domain